MEDISKFYQGKRVLLTGHTGFKGSWMSLMLSMMGAEVTGYSSDKPTDPALFDLLQLNNDMNSIQGDIRDLNHLKAVFDEAKPDIVLHLAAQPIVRTSYQEPVYTYETNVMGTVNLMECVRLSDSVRSVVNVTTDKVYRNREWQWGYRENEELCGFDPYSNSKSCSELVTDSYRNSFFADRETAISTMRAGNVIGGGDFAKDRIIPDCVRAAQQNKQMIVRNPYSTRPYQHVLEPVWAYLMVAKAQYEDLSLAGSYNIGPEETDCWATGDLVDAFCKKWNDATGQNLSWINQYDGGPHEANFLKLDCSKIKSTFGWKPVWNVDRALDEIVEWTHAYFQNEDIKVTSENCIRKFMY